MKNPAVPTRAARPHGPTRAGKWLLAFLALCVAYFLYEAATARWPEAVALRAEVSAFAYSMTHEDLAGFVFIVLLCIGFGAFLLMRTARQSPR